jgi:hypothetical protein
MSNIEKKFDKIISLLQRIDAKLGDIPSGAIENERLDKSIQKPTAPTKAQLKFKDSTDFWIRQDRLSDFRAIRLLVKHYRMTNKSEWGKVEFTTSALESINKKIQTYGLQFYIDYKYEVLASIKNITREMELLLEKEVGKQIAIKKSGNKNI